MSDLNNEDNAEPEKDNAKVPVMRRLLITGKEILFHSWVNVLLVFVPVGIAVHFAGVNENVVFAINAIAIIPLAGLLTFATESVAHRLGPTLGALINVSFGNAVELIIFIIALVKNEIRIVQASLIGSILANLLLILGMAFLIGGLEYQEQVYDSTVTQLSACLLALAVLSLLIPTAFHASFNDNDLANRQVLKLSRGTSIILLVVYVLYLLFQLKSHAYLYKGVSQQVIDEQSHPGFLSRFDSTSSSSSSTASSRTGSERKVSKRQRVQAKLGKKRHEKVEVEDAIEEASPRTWNANLAEVNEKAMKLHELGPQAPKPGIQKALTDPAATGAGASITSARPDAMSRGLSFRPPPVFRKQTEGLPQTQRQKTPGSRPHDLRRLQSPLRVESAPSSTDAKDKQRFDGHPRSPSPPKTESDEPPMSQTASIILLLVSTVLIALCAEFLVGSINHLVSNSPLSEAFIGLIILPIVGNAAEHVTAVTVAAKNKIDLALGVSLGSSIQIALFVTPIVVILGWILDKDMSLYFNLFETATLFVSTFIVNFLVLDGRSNYLEGALLFACYIIIA